MKKLINQLYPFFLLGVAIVALGFGMILLAYLFLFGLIVGLAIFLISAVRNAFFPKKTIVTRKKSGRIIDVDDWKKL